MQRKIDIPAIHDKDLKSLLSEFNYSSRIEKGVINCQSCDSVITWENLAAMKVMEEKLIFFCNNPDCIECATKLQQNG